MKITAIVYFIFISLILGCSDNHGCFVAETVTPVKKITITGLDHFLYLRSSGFSEKENFFELYKNKPEFDDCGKASLTPLSEVHIDSSKEMIDKVVIDKHKLTIVYSKEKTQSNNLVNVPVEVK